MVMIEDAQEIKQPQMQIEKSVNKDQQKMQAENEFRVQNEEEEEHSMNIELLN